MGNLCAGTPKITVRDNRGLVARTLRYNHSQAGDVATQYVDAQVYNTLGQLASSQDARFFGTGTRNFEFTPALSGQVLKTVSADAGATQACADIAGCPAWEQSQGRDSLNQADNQFITTHKYDALARPTARWVNVRPLQGGPSSDHQTDVWVYGDSQRLPSGAYDPTNKGDPRNLNLRGQRFRHYDTAGVLDMSTRGYDVQGNVPRQDRQLLGLDSGAFTGVTHGWKGIWPNVDTSGLDPLVYRTTWTYNALAQVLTQTDAQGHQQQTAYDAAGRKVSSAVTPRGGKHTPVIAGVTYTASGQIEARSDANGIQTVYTYEPQITQRVRSITATRSSASASAAAARRAAGQRNRNSTGTTLQDLTYTYDGVGNVMALNDSSTPVTYFHNGAVDGSRRYSYDALYQLISASGRENSASSTPSATDSPNVISPLDQANYRSYTRHYLYDLGGNLRQIAAANPAGTGATVPTRDMIVAADSNRSVSNAKNGGLTAGTVNRFFDSAGQSICLDGNANQPMYWTPYKQLYCLVTLYRDDAPDASAPQGNWHASDCELYAYDSEGQRIRKAAQTNSAGTAWTDDAIYLPGLELRQNHQTGEQLEVIVLDDGARMLNWTNKQPAGTINQQIRYRYGDRQNSCQIETDDTARIITQEEYYPYGGTAVWAAESQSEAKYKTIRYSGKERDAAGLYYYGFRYYQPWTGRWINPDPAGTIDGQNLYRMAENNPISHEDAEGLDSRESETTTAQILGAGFTLTLMFGLMYLLWALNRSSDRERDRRMDDEHTIVSTANEMQAKFDLSDKKKNEVAALMRELGVHDYEHNIHARMGKLYLDSVPNDKEKEGATIIDRGDSVPQRLKKIGGRSVFIQDEVRTEVPYEDGPIFEFPVAPAYSSRPSSIASDRASASGAQEQGGSKKKRGQTVLSQDSGLGGVRRSKSDASQSDAASVHAKESVNYEVLNAEYLNEFQFTTREEKTLAKALAALGEPKVGMKVHRLRPNLVMKGRGGNFLKTEENLESIDLPGFDGAKGRGSERLIFKTDHANRTRTIVGIGDTH
ncbi:RHS repeat-associated core domain-containing protein [Bordetella sp. LUAb4]|uniref:RHS repeat-associated core domain-containing protein n=1 Tax=Bordetella sp. LUAb4 TaxID=2843195 RepID=UPI001E35B954|nr:RHS repeat-associated core domain-containing protein [Bordetella sp. LUAb4]